MTMAIRSLASKGNIDCVSNLWLLFVIKYHVRGLVSKPLGRFEANNTIRNLTYN